MRPLHDPMRHAAAVKAACILCAAIVVATPAFGQTWNNATTNKNFADFGNWTGSLTTFTGTNRDWIINSTGANRAELSTAVGNVQRDLLVGTGAGAQGELLIQSGGSMTVTRNLRMGQSGGTAGYGIVTMNGGSLNISTSLFVGQSDNAANVFTLNSGTVAVTSTLNVAHAASTQGTLDIKGGTLTASNGVFADGGTGNSIATLNISGSGALSTTTTGLVFGNTNTTGTSSATINLSNSASLTSATSISVAFGQTSTASINMTGGTLSAKTSFLTLGQNGGTNVAVTMSGGLMETDRLALASAGTAGAGTTTLTMSGGQIKVERWATSTNTGSGGFRLGSAGATVLLSGGALIDAELLRIIDGGSIDAGGQSVISMSGSKITDVNNNLTRPTFDFTEAYVGTIPWSSVNGLINFSSFDSRLEVIGVSETVVVGAGPATQTVNFVELFNAAITNNKFTRSVGSAFLVNYDPVTNRTAVSVVPEPATFALGLGGVALAGLAMRARCRRG
jgi:hypothetical protein